LPASVAARRQTAFSGRDYLVGGALPSRRYVLLSLVGSKISQQGSNQNGHSEVLY
jgi:hypothetical protein